MDGSRVEKSDAVDRLVSDHVRVSVDDEIWSRLDGLRHLFFEVSVRRDDSPATDRQPHGRMIDHEIEATGVGREGPILIDVAKN